MGAREGAAVVGAGVGASVCETSKSTYVQEQKSVIFSRQSPFVGCTVGAGVGAGVVGACVRQLSICTTPHDVDAHWVPENASCMVKPSP